MGIVLDIAAAFELPAGAAQKYVLRSPWAADAAKPAITVSAGRPHPWQAAVPAAPFSMVNMASGYVAYLGGDQCGNTAECEGGDGCPCGCVLAYEPDPVHSGERLFKITDASDNELVLGYDDAGNGRLVSITVLPIGPPEQQVERVCVHL